MSKLREGHCFPPALVGVNVGLALIDAIVAAISYFQLIRIHLRNLQVCWTRQKVFHLMIGSSNLGNFIYFVLTLVAACKGWIWWSQPCGFIFMAFPKIFFFAAFLLLLSFWVDLCHQPDEEDDDEGSFVEEALLEKTLNESHSASNNSHRKCFPVRLVHVGNRQKIVILVTVLVFVIMLAFAVIIWIGLGKNPIDSTVATRVYVDFFAVGMLLLAGALACYGIMLCLKMSNVRSEEASSEMWKVASLTVVSVLCFTSSAFVALLTDIPMLYHWHKLHLNCVYSSFLLILYYFVGASIPSVMVLWVMRELPPTKDISIQEESDMLAYVPDSSVAIYPQRWTTVTSFKSESDIIVSYANLCKHVFFFLPEFGELGAAASEYAKP